MRKAYSFACMHVMFIDCNVKFAIDIHDRLLHGLGRTGRRTALRERP